MYDISKCMITHLFLIYFTFVSEYQVDSLVLPHQSTTVCTHCTAIWCQPGLSGGCVDVCVTRTNAPTLRYIEAAHCLKRMCHYILWSQLHLSFNSCWLHCIRHLYLYLAIMEFWIFFFVWFSSFMFTSNLVKAFWCLTEGYKRYMPINSSNHKTTIKLTGYMLLEFQCSTVPSFLFPLNHMKCHSLLSIITALTLTKYSATIPVFLPRRPGGQHWALILSEYSKYVQR